MSKQPSIKIGDKFKINNGDVVEVLEYLSVKSITIKFPEGHTEAVRGDELRSGLIRNRMKPVGNVEHFIGEYTRENCKYWDEIYSIWSGLIHRCSNTKIKGYEDVSVCHEWLNFSIFYDWAINYKDEIIKGYDLDKDIIKKGNLLYSPTTCCFVPPRVNRLFVQSCKSVRRGEYPIGVHFHKVTGKFAAQCQIDGKRTWLGAYDSIQEAFAVFKIHREAEIKRMAEKYKSAMKEEVYTAMLNYEVEITD